MRYPPNFTQHLTAEDLSGVSKFCTYEGLAPDLKHLRGLMIETLRVEELVYVGERENIWAELADGTRIRPWMNTYIRELDAYGNDVPYDPILSPPVVLRPDAMTTAELAAFGYTEQDLIDLAKEHLGEVYEPDRGGASDLRRSVFNRVKAKVYAG